MAQQSGATGGNPGAVTLGALILMVEAVVFVPYGMSAKSAALADACAGSFMANINVAIGLTISCVVALAIFLVAVVVGAANHSRLAVGIGVALAVAAPIAFEIGVAIVTGAGGSSCG